MKNKLVNLGVVFLLVLSLMPNVLLASEKQTTNITTTPETTNTTEESSKVEDLQPEDVNPDGDIIIGKEEKPTNQPESEKVEPEKPVEPEVTSPKEDEETTNKHEEAVDKPELRANQSGNAYDVWYEENWKIAVGGYNFYLGRITTKNGNSMFCIEPEQLTTGNGTVGASAVWNSLSTKTQRSLAQLVALERMHNPTSVGNDWYYGAQFAIYQVLGYGSPQNISIPSDIYSRLMATKDIYMSELNTFGMLPSMHNQTLPMHYDHKQKAYIIDGMVDTNGIISSHFRQLNGFADPTTGMSIGVSADNRLYARKDTTPVNPATGDFWADNNTTGGLMEYGNIPFGEGPVFVGDPQSQDVIGCISDPVQWAVGFKPIRGYVHLLKTTQTGKVLPGAEFAIYHDANNNKMLDAGEPEYYRGTSDANGIFESAWLADGNYIVKETKAPAGYDTPNYTGAFTINQDDQMVDMGTVTNNKLGEIHLSKVDNYNLPVADVEFSVYNDVNGNKKYDKGDTLVSTIKTDSNGKASLLNMKFGNYVIKETKNPWNFLAPTYEEAFTLKPGSVIYLNSGKPIINTLIEGKIELNKVDDYNKPLARTEFTVYPALSNIETGQPILDAKGQLQFSDKKIAGTIVTDETGYGSLDKLAPGTYKVKETKAPNGYVNGNYEEIIKVVDDQIIKLNKGKPITNTKIEGYIVVNKTDGNGTKLQGVEFTIYQDTNKNGQYDNADQVQEVLTTDVDGSAVSSYLPEGTYFVKETKPLDGYIGSDKVEKFVVDAKSSIVNGKLVATYNVVNNKITVTSVQTGSKDTTIILSSVLVISVLATAIFLRKRNN